MSVASTVDPCFPELFDAVSGERTEGLTGAITIAGQVCAGRGIKARRALGAAFVPEERLGHGAVPDFPLSKTIRLEWLEDGDHGFKPRKASGRTEQQNWEQALNAIQAFCATI